MAEGSQLWLRTLGEFELARKWRVSTIAKLEGPRSVIEQKVLDTTRHIFQHSAAI